jgi:hypothetical protein
MRTRFTTAVVSLAVGAAVWGAPAALADQAPDGPHDPGSSHARDIPVVTDLLQGLGLAPAPVVVPVVTVPGGAVPAVPVVPVPSLPTSPAVAPPSVPALPTVPPVAGGAGAGGSVGTSGADADGGISAQ